MWNKERQQYIFFFLLIGAALVLSFLVLRPYLLILLLGLVLSVAVDPVNIFIRRVLGGRKRFAAIVTILLVTIVVIAPLAYFSYQIFLEAQHVYTSLSEDSLSGDSFRAQLEQSTGFLHTAWEEVSGQLDSIAQNALNFLVTRIGSIFASVANIAINLIILFISMYYFLSRRELLRASIKRISPLEDAYDEMVIQKIKSASNSVVRGSLAVALAQGIVASIGYTIFGVPAPMIWGGVTALAALVPTFGTSLITAPAIAYLFITGHTTEGIGLIIWAFAAVGLIDNFLGPLLIDRGTNLNQLVILVAILGGVALFGAIGFFAGPLVIAFLMALLDAYSAFNKKTGSVVSS